MSFLAQDHKLKSDMKGSNSSTAQAAPETAPSHKNDPATAPMQGVPSSSNESEIITVAPGFEITFAEADQVLQQFTAEMIPQFPFVVPPASTAPDLLKNKPLLLKTMVWVCRPPSPDCSKEFERWFRQQVAHQTVILVNKSLDILQALLVFLAWSDVHFYANARETSLMQLALGLVEDLRLTKRPGISNRASESLVEDAARLRNDAKPHIQHSNDDRRAVLGVFYSTSILSVFMGKASRLEYASYFDLCCEHLLQGMETPTDLLLVKLVRLRHIANKVQDNFPLGEYSGNQSSCTSMHFLAIAAVQKEVDSFIGQLPDSLKWNALLRSQCAAVRIRLFDPILHGHRPNNLETSFPRSQLVWDCLRSANVIFDTFLSAPSDSYLPLTFASNLHLALAIIKTTRVLLTDDPDWDLGAVRSTFNISDVLQQLSDRFDICSRLNHPRCTALVEGRPYFSEYAERFRWMQASYLSKIGVQNATSDHTVSQPSFLTDFDQHHSLEFWRQLSTSAYSMFL